MHDDLTHLELTISFLAKVVADAAGNAGAVVDPSVPFGELGIDSFRVLKIIKALESAFGPLPKTLLFEYFNTELLARYFLDKHRPALEAKFGGQLAAGAEAGKTAPAVQVPHALKAPAPAPAAPEAPPTTAVRLLEQDLPGCPELNAIVATLMERHMNEGSVSRGTRNIAPNLFIGSARKGFFNYCRHQQNILVYAYTGPDEYFAELADEMYAFCREKKFELSIFADRHIGEVGGVAFSATPFGALQRVLQLQEFSLEGGPMRRLRYQVGKFEKAGVGRTVEYRCGTDPQVDQDIAGVIDKWRETKTMVNPLIGIVRDEILAGTLDPKHRLFLTYLDDKLENVILISRMCSALNGYLMDLEFYSKGMPLGGLEFGIANIIRTLAAEGCDMFSLGGTYGVRLETSPHADPEVDAILDELHKQNIFNDESNLQFKNKFRPENRTIYICRPVGSGNPGSVIDIIMMIADPAKGQTSDAENHHPGGDAAAAVATVALPAMDGQAQVIAQVIDGEPRSAALAEHGFNPLKLPAERVEFDLKTDSWAQLDLPVIARRTRHFLGQMQHPANLTQSLRAIFPFEFFALADSGRSAENVLCQAWERKGIVPQNLLFPTTIFHQIDKGFTPREMPLAAVFDAGGQELYKGNLDLPSLQEQVERAGADIAYVCIELSNNAAGGYPVAAAHLRQVKALLARRSIPLVIDGTRVIENARFLIESDEAYRALGVWDTVRELLGHADVLVASLAKDFCVPKGGLVASNDAQLMRRVSELVERTGCGLDAIDKRLMALALQDTAYIAAQTAQRFDCVRRLFAALKQGGVPLVEPAGGHCVLVDVKRIAAFQTFAQPVASFLACLYLNTGIRAGAHNAGMQKNTALNDVVRLAVPVGMAPAQVEEIGARIVSLFGKLCNIPELAAEGGAAENPGDIHTRYRLVRYHSPAGALVSMGDAAGPASPAAPVAAAASPAPAPPAPATAADGSHAAPALQRHLGSDVAIVGMAGRYPKANNLAQLWNNLVEKRDCVEDIPAERFEERLPNAFSRRYRGGFMDGIDRFDAPFFSIPAEEAAILDPQERLFLEVAYEAVEDAGYHPEILARDDASRNIGVFVGAVWAMYQMLGVEEKIAGNERNPTSFFWSIANRVSYWMNLTGPSMTLDTACSSSLTAIKLACDAIRNGECSGAIVGGVNLDLHQSKLDVNAMGGSLSSDGVCRSFGKGANGYVSGEGVGALFLKPLAQAVADGDHVYGVIRSAVVTHGGKTSGYTIPSPRPQAELIRRAIERAGVDARSIGYVEAHGTATALGDSIEIAGLTQAFAHFGVAPQSCAIGSVKTNIGHLEAASGIVGVHKILLQMMHRTLVPSLHAEQTSESIDFASSPFYVQQDVRDWAPKVVDGRTMPRCAGISAMGAGGTNAHLVIEEYVAEKRDQALAAPAPVTRVFPISAKSADQLRQAAARLRDFLHGAQAQRADAGWFERDVAHTLRVGRKCFEFRLAVLAATREELAAKLGGFVDGLRSDDVIEGHVRNAAAVTGLLNPGETREFVGLLAQSGDPRRIARLWCDGVIPEWSGVGTGEPGRRIPLPTYPFAHQRYWVRERQAGPGVSARASAALPAVQAGPGAGFPVARPLERYQFSSYADIHALAGQLANLSVEYKARLYVGQLLADRLGLAIDEIDHWMQLMDTGLTSLDMAAMTQAIKQDIDPAFSPTVFFECTTVESLCTMLATRYAAAFEKVAVARQGADEACSPRPERRPMPDDAAADTGTVPLHVLDAQSELALPAALPAVSAAPAEGGPARCVLLTGATGFLGIHVLAEWLAAHPEGRVLCLVRASDAEHGLRRILEQASRFRLEVDSRRVTVLCGDIGMPALGLRDEEWELCAREAQQIVHASAHVNHIEGYATFRDSARGIKEIIRLAATHRVKLIQFISSIAVCARKLGDEFSFHEHEDFLDDGEQVYGGYGQSKWVQETCLRRAHERGIPYVIYRFGELSGSARTGLAQSDDMLHRLLQMRLAIGCREKISSDVLDMLPVDFAATLLVGTAGKPELWNRIVHATHTKPYSFANVYRLARTRGVDCVPVAREEFLAGCGEFVEYMYSTNAVNGFVLECMLRDLEGSVRNRKMMDSYFAVLFPFDQDNFKRTLQALGLALPDWNDLIELYFDTWESEESGFMAGVRAFRAWLAAKSEQVQGERKIIELFLDEEAQ